jgi:hypothetical protein
MTEKNIGIPGNSNELYEFPIEGGAITLHGILSVPDRAHGLVILPRGIKVQESDTAQRRAVAQTGSFHQQGLATLLVDLFSSQEHDLDMQTAAHYQPGGMAVTISQGAGTFNRLTGHRINRNRHSHYCCGTP